MSQQQQQQQIHRGSKLDDLIYFRVTSSSSSSSNNNNNWTNSREPAPPPDDIGNMLYNDERNFLRPGTARSLPTPNCSNHNANNNETDSDEAAEKTSLMNTRFLNVDYGGGGGNNARPRNLSYPSLNSLPPPPPTTPNSVRLINVAASNKSINEIRDDDDDILVEDVLQEKTSRREESSRGRGGEGGVEQKKRPSKAPGVPRKTSRLPTPVPTTTTSTSPNLIELPSPSSHVGMNGGSGSGGSPVSPNKILLTNGNGSRKSNLDFFLDYSRNPFTTKYEVLGNSKEPNDAQPDKKPKSNTNLKELEVVDMNASVRRSASISNLGEKTANNLSSNDQDQHHRYSKPQLLHLQKHQQSNNQQDMMIVSPNLIKPSYATSPTQSTLSSSKTSGNIQQLQQQQQQPQQHQRNNSTNNLYPIVPPHNRKTSLMNEMKGRISSISDENLAVNSANPSKFKLTNRNGLITNNQLVKISDWVYCGNLNSVKNERALCHLGIEYVIDMSNLRPDDLSRAQTLGKLPCSCKRQQHSRFYLTIELRETSFKTLFAAFNEINKFIQQAKNSSHQEKTNNTTTVGVDENKRPQRRVLIFGREGLGSDHVRCACAQYLMIDCGMKFIKALNVLQAKTKGSMKKCYIEYLSQFEVYLDHMIKNLKSSGYHVQNLDMGGLVNENGFDEEDFYDDDQDNDDYEIESNDYDDDPADVPYRRTTTAAAGGIIKSARVKKWTNTSVDSGGGGSGGVAANSAVESISRHNHNHHGNRHHNHHHHNPNDLELDNLSDLSDNFTVNSSSSEVKAVKSKIMSSFRKMSSSDSEKTHKELPKRNGTSVSTRNISNNSNNNNSNNNSTKSTIDRVAHNRSFKMAWM